MRSPRASAVAWRYSILYLDALAIVRGTLVDVACCFVTSHKGDRLDVPVVQNAVDCVVSAVHHIQDAPTCQSECEAALCPNTKKHECARQGLTQAQQQPMQLRRR